MTTTDLFVLAMSDHSRIARIRRATAFWDHLDNDDAYLCALDAVGMAEILAVNPAHDCLQLARQLGHDEQRIAAAANHAVTI